MSLEGRFAYAWPAGDRPARSRRRSARRRSTSTAPTPSSRTCSPAASAGDGLRMAARGTLALNVARSSVAGVAVQGTDVSLRFDGRALESSGSPSPISAGASVAAKGNIDISARAPRGTVTLDLDVRNLDGVAGLLDKFSPVPAAAELRRSGPRFVPAKLQASLAVDQEAARTRGHLRREIHPRRRAGPFPIDLQGDADGRPRLDLHRSRQARRQQDRPRRSARRAGRRRAGRIARARPPARGRQGFRSARPQGRRRRR